MTHAGAIQLGRQHLIDQYDAGWFALDTHHKYGERPDIICLVKDEVWQVEVKVSRSDFLANRDKKLLGIGHRRYYLVVQGVCLPSDLPAGYGLQVIREDDSERPHIYTPCDSSFFSMNKAAIAQTLKLYANQDRRQSKKREATGEWKDVEILLAVDDYGLTLKQIKLDLEWSATRTNAFSNAAKRNELPKTIAFELHESPWVFRRAG